MLRAALNDATVLSAWMSGGKSFHRMIDLGGKAFNARDDLTVVPGIYDRADDSVTTYRKLEAVSVVDTEARACFLSCRIATK